LRQLYDGQAHLAQIRKAKLAPTIVVADKLYPIKGHSASAQEVTYLPRLGRISLA
jgi:hypothetical protein